MKKFYRFVCLIAIFTIVCCCFAGCFGGSIDVDDVDTEDVTTVNKDKTTVDISTTPTIGSTKSIVTDYKYCWLLRPDGDVIIGDVVSWIMVSENLIQVTLTNTYRPGGSAYNDGKTCTYLLSPDRVWFNTRKGEG